MTLFEEALPVMAVPLFFPKSDNYFVEMNYFVHIQKHKNENNNLTA
jgi:hypothetical protein